MKENPVWLVARREVREQTRTTAFRVATAITVLLVAAAIIVPSLIGSDGPDERTVAFVEAPSAPVRDALEAVAPALGTEVEITSAAGDAEARRLVGDGDADVAVLADGSLLVDKSVDTGDPSEVDKLALTLGEVLRVQRGLEAAGLTPEQAAEALNAPPPPIASIEPAEASSDDRDTARAAALAANILLFVCLQFYGTWTLMGVTEEKSSRVVEVLIAAVRPSQLLMGKVIGIGLTALAHAALLLTVAVGAAVASGSSLVSGVGLSTVFIAGLWLLVGYSFYSTVFAAAGSLCSRSEDAQSIAFPLLLPALVAYLAGFGALGSGEDNIVMVVMSFLPPTAPLAMPVRYGIGTAPWWQVVIAVAVTLAGAVVVGRLAGRIYEGSLLRTGKRVKLKEALKPV